MNEEKQNILAVDLEPTPYKTDLWNAFADSGKVNLSVIYTERRNWAPDGGHDYQKWPEYRHDHLVLDGQGRLGAFKSALKVVSAILQKERDLIFIAGYTSLATIVSIFFSVIARRRFVVHADEFNNSRPKGRFCGVKFFVRESLRDIVFTYGAAVLVCGKRGIESALQAGCPQSKILNSPYVVDAERMKSENPTQLPAGCQQDIDGHRLIILFSGRMIPRKGLPTLLNALTRIKTNDKDWVLWIEGDGPELDRYSQLAKDLKVDDRCRFLGFCQYDVHSKLICSSDIVLVPSLEDSWGIVVDEGLQLGKAVVSSDATGSGYDRIVHGQNGYLFPAGDVDVLLGLLQRLIDDKELRLKLGAAAISNPKNLRPSDNLETLLSTIHPAPDK